MTEISFGVVECLLVGFFVFGSYIKNKIDNYNKNKNIQDYFQCGIHFCAALYTVYNLYNTNTFNGNLLQESNKMFAHYNKNLIDIVSAVKKTLEEFDAKNKEVIEMTKTYNQEVIDTNDKNVYKEF
jgi:hypothetical protein